MNNTKVYFPNVASSSSYSPYNNKSIICSSDNLFIQIANNFAKYYTSNNITNYINLLPKLISLQKSNPNYKNNAIALTISSLIDCLSSMININIDLNNQLLFLENNDLFIIKKPQIVIQNQTINQNTSIKLIYMQYLLMYDISASNGIFIDKYLSNAQNVLNFNNGFLVTNKAVFATFY